MGGGWWGTTHIQPSSYVMYDVCIYHVRMYAPNPPLNMPIPHHYLLLPLAAAAAAAAGAGGGRDGPVFAGDKG